MTCHVLVLEICAVLLILCTTLASSASIKDTKWSEGCTGLLYFIARGCGITSNPRKVTQSDPQGSISRHLLLNFAMAVLPGVISALSMIPVLIAIHTDDVHSGVLPVELGRKEC